MIGDCQGAIVASEGEDLGVSVGMLVGVQDLLYCGQPTYDQTELRIVGCLLGPCIHFLPVLLVFENQCDHDGFVGNIWIGVMDDGAFTCAKYDATKRQDFCSAW